MSWEEKISSNLALIRENIRSYAKGEVQLLAVTKKQSIEKLKILAKLGICDFGENYIQELKEKRAYFSNFFSLTWHYIGRMQSNKLKKILLFSDVIHSVSSLSQLEKMDRYARELGEKVSLYLQINLTKEEHKGGFFVEELKEVLPCLSESSYLKTLGFMCMSSKEQSRDEKRSLFRSVADLLREWRGKFTCLGEGLSMGMSDDYPLALLEGSTCLRLGEALLGKRED